MGDSKQEGGEERISAFLDGGREEIVGLWSLLHCFSDESVSYPDI